MLDCANSGGQLAIATVAFAVVAALDVNTRPGVWICRKWYLPPQYPKNADGQLRND